MCDDVAGDGGFVSGVFWQLLRAFFIKFKMAGTILHLQSKFLADRLFGYVGKEMAIYSWLKYQF
jgi:hypothetical protein